MELKKSISGTVLGGRKERRHSCSRFERGPRKPFSERIVCRSVAAPCALLIAGALALFPLRAAEWQWSVPVGEGRAYLWIPPDCDQVRGVVVGQHNMSEEGILEHPRFRAELATLALAAVFVAPPFDPVFDFSRDAAQRFDAMIAALAEESGYVELAFAPVAPIGHSACASYVWNFGAWNPGRTLAMLSVHGDAPLTTMTGSGRSNPAWGDRTIDGVPGVMVMAEYEWLEGRLEPLLAFRERFPGAPVALLAEPGRGHFDVADELVDYLALFLRKAVAARLPGLSPTDRPPVLRAVEPAAGWLVERWRLNQPRRYWPAPVSAYGGDPREATWVFDEEMAWITHRYFTGQVGKKPTLLAFVQRGEVVPQRESPAQVELAFQPQADGVTFTLEATFLDHVDRGASNTTRWTGLPPGSALERPRAGVPIRLSRITGPVEQVNATTFRVALNRTASTHDRRERDLWLLAEYPGDATFKSSVQQALLRLPDFGVGREQTITFAAMPDVAADAGPIPLMASSDAGLPVGFYVREGPAVVRNGALHFKSLPVRARYPVSVTVVAWQLGRGGLDPVRKATSIEQTFLITRDED